MPSTCVQNIGTSSETFFDSLPAKSFSHPEKNKLSLPAPEKSEEADTKELGDFEFLLDNNNFTMLPADQLFSDGKLMPLHLSTVKVAVSSSEPPLIRVKSPKTTKLSRNDVSIMDPYLFSPKAPRCTTSWKELLGLRKVQNKSNSSSSFKDLINRNSKSSTSLSFDGSVNLPLLKHSENESKFVTLPRVSVTKPRRSSILENTNNTTGKSTMRRSIVAAERGMDSPRMNASGKIVYNSLERSSSSPSSYGGPRYKYSSVQRSYSANVRVTNVPVCSLRGSSSSKSGGVLGLFGSSSTQPKRDSFGSSNGMAISRRGRSGV